MSTYLIIGIAVAVLLCIVGGFNDDKSDKKEYKSPLTLKSIMLYLQKNGYNPKEKDDYVLFTHQETVMFIFLEKIATMLLLV